MKRQQKSLLGKRQSLLMLSLAILIFILILSGGYLYYRYEKNAIRQEKYTDLKMISELKAQQIVSWREERLANAQVIAESPFFRQKSLDWLLSKDKTIEKELLQRLLLTKSEYNYEDIFMVSAEGEPLLGHNPALKNIDTLTLNLCANVLHDGKLFISEPYFCLAHNTIHLDIIAPVRNDKNVPAVVLVLRVNPSDFLFPYIQAWPTSSKTAETLILRKDGDSILYVNELRHVSNTALKLRISLSKIEVPAVKAVLGHEGIWEGPDYRDVKVLAYMRPITGTSWFMVSKIDQSEIYAELKYRTVVIIIITLLLLLFSGIWISWLYNNRQKNIYRKLLETGTSLQESEHKFRETIKYLDEGYYSVTTDGILLDHNQAFNRILGFDISEDMKGVKLPDFWQNPDERKSYLQELMTSGFIRNYLINAKKADGQKIVVMANAHLVKDEYGRVLRIEGTFIDFTDLKRTEEALRESIRMNNSIMHAAQDIIVLKDNNFNFRLVNPAMCNLLGKAENEIIGKTDFDLFPYELAEKYRSDDKYIIKIGQSVSYEEEVSSHKGIRYVSTIKAPVLDEKNVCQGIVVITRDITERKRIEESLRKSEKDLLESQRIAHVGSWRLDNETNQVVWTEELYNMFGYDPSLPPPLYTEHMKLFTLESWERLSAALAHTRETGIPYTLELETVRKDGSNGWVWVQGEADIDPAGKIAELWGVAQDITERVLAQKELEQHRNHLEQLVADRTAELKNSEEKFRTVADFAFDWEYWIDQENRMLYVSPSCERVTGFLPVSFHEDPQLIEKIIHPDDRQVFEKHIKAFHGENIKREKTELEFRIITKTGYTKWIGHSCTPVIGDNGVYMGRRASNRDMNESKKAQNEIKELNETLTRRKTELEASNKELEAFSYSVSHDLRAPLRHVSGYVELLNKQFLSDLPDKGQHYLNSIDDSVHVMGALIDDLLQFSRTGRMEMRMSDFDMNEIVKEVIETLRKDNPDRKIEWIVGKLASINGDKSMLRLVWTNLLSNAVKFTRTRKKARIEIGVRKEKKEAVFFVRDNGVGFDMQYAQKLFGVFQRLHSTEEFEGTGIGLANVQRIVLRHGGRVWAEAEPGKGAVFYFSIPNK